jgi:pimeloyl-ACP methyl ester carboxylesterase
MKHMKQQLISLKTRDKLGLEGIFFSPEGLRTGNAVLHLHDWFGWFYSDWDYILNAARYLVGRGHSFLSINTRGCGSAWTSPPVLGLSAASSEARWMGGRYELFHECIDDVQAGIDFLIGQACPDIVLEGVGLGASKAVHYQSEVQNPKVKSVVINSPRDFVGEEMARPSFEQTLSVAEHMIAKGEGSQLVASFFGHRVSALSYASKFGVEGRVSGIHWLDALRERPHHPVERVSSPILVLRVLTHDAMCRSDFLSSIEGRATGRCESIDIQKLRQKYAPQSDINRILAEAISDWVDDVLP